MPSSPPDSERLVEQELEGLRRLALIYESMVLEGDRDAWDRVEEMVTDSDRCIAELRELEDRRRSLGGREDARLGREATRVEALHAEALDSLRRMRGETLDRLTTVGKGRRLLGTKAPGVSGV